MAKYQQRLLPSRLFTAQQLHAGWEASNRWSTLSLTYFVSHTLSGCFVIPPHTKKAKHTFAWKNGGMWWCWQQSKLWWKPNPTIFEKRDFFPGHGLHLRVVQLWLWKTIILYASDESRDRRMAFVQSRPGASARQQALRPQIQCPTFNMEEVEEQIREGLNLTLPHHFSCHHPC